MSRHTSKGRWYEERKFSNSEECSKAAFPPHARRCVLGTSVVTLVRTESYSMCNVYPGRDVTYSLRDGCARLPVHACDVCYSVKDQSA